MNPLPHLARHWPLLALAVVTAVAAWLRLQQANESLWLDELHTAWCVDGSLADVAPRAAIGNQSPLYFYVVWGVTQAFGTSELSLRLVSLACGMALPATLYFVVRHWTATVEPSASYLAAIVAALLLTFDPLAIFYAQEARPYACVQLFAIVHVVIFAQLLERTTSGRRAGWILSGVVLFYLHYTAALVIAGEVVFFAAASLIQRTGAYRPQQFVVDLALLVVLWLPAANQLQDIAARRDNWAAFVHPQPITAIVTLFPWSMAAPFVVIAILVQTSPKRKRGKTEASAENSLPSLAHRASVDWQAALLCMSWLFVPLVVAWLLTRTELARLFFERYLIASLSASYILTALCIPLAPPRIGRAVVALTFIAAAFHCSGIAQQLRYDGRIHSLRREDWRGAVAYLNTQLSQYSLPILLRSGLIEANALRGGNDPALRKYCLYPVTSLYRLENSAGVELIPLPTADAGKLAPDVQDTIVARRGAWLVLRATRETSAAIERDIRASLRNHHVVVTIPDARPFGNLWIVRVEISSAEDPLGALPTPRNE